MILDIYLLPLPIYGRIRYDLVCNKASFVHGDPCTLTCSGKKWVLCRETCLSLKYTKLAMHHFLPYSIKNVNYSSVHVFFYSNADFQLEALFLHSVPVSPMQSRVLMVGRREWMFFL